MANKPENNVEPEIQTHLKSTNQEDDKISSLLPESLFGELLISSPVSSTESSKSSSPSFLSTASSGEVSLTGNLAANLTALARLSSQSEETDDYLGASARSGSSSGSTGTDFFTTTNFVEAGMTNGMSSPFSFLDDLSVAQLKTENPVVPLRASPISPAPPPPPSHPDNFMNVRSKFGCLGHQPRMFHMPHGFCLGEKEEIYVADTNNHRVQVITHCT